MPPERRHCGDVSAFGSAAKFRAMYFGRIHAPNLAGRIKRENWPWNSVPAALVTRGPPFQENSMKLYYTPGACSMSPHIVAMEAGLPHDLVRVDLKTHKTADGEDYYSINPKGYVPALKLDSGEVLTEGPAIVQYLADQKPQAHLLPKEGTVARYHAIEWLAFINSELHKTFSPLFGGQLSNDAQKATKEKILKRFEYVESRLSGDYLMGSQFTAPDAYLFVMLNWARAMQIDISGLPKLTAYFARVAARPQVQATLKMEGLA
jgi:glutathione S-transferase